MSEQQTDPRGIDPEERAEHVFWARQYLSPEPLTPELLRRHQDWLRRRLGIPALTELAPLAEEEDQMAGEERGRVEEINGLSIPNDAAKAITRFGHACRDWGRSGTHMIPQEARDAEGELIGAVAGLTPAPPALATLTDAELAATAQAAAEALTRRARES